MLLPCGPRWKWISFPKGFPHRGQHIELSCLNRGVGRPLRPLPESPDCCDLMLWSMEMYGEHSPVGDFTSVSHQILQVDRRWPLLEDSTALIELCTRCSFQFPHQRATWVPTSHPFFQDETTAFLSPLPRVLTSQLTGNIKGHSRDAEMPKGLQFEAVQAPTIPLPTVGKATDAQIWTSH